MKPQDVDKKRAARNPWGLTACQCMTMRLMCEHGGTKRVAYGVEEAHPRLLEHHIMITKRKMGLFGADIRLYLMWDRWTRTQE